MIATLRTQLLGLSKRRILAIACLSILVGIAVLLLFWKPLGVFFLRQHSIKYYKAIYAKPTEFAVPVDEYDWAWRFGMDTGLDDLTELTVDPVITPNGRSLASNLVVGIQENKYDAYLEAMVNPIESVNYWPRTDLIEYMLEGRRKRPLRDR